MPLDVQATQLAAERAARDASNPMAKLNPHVISVYQKASLDPETFMKTKDPVQMNANDTAQYVGSKNDTMALGSLANELVMTGSYASVLKPDAQKAIKTLIQQKAPGATQQAAALVSSALTSAFADPAQRKTVIQLIDQLATDGAHPSAMLISRNMVRGQTQPTN
jgi:hypothetical protein